MAGIPFAWLFFGLTGRVSRRAYFLAGLLLYLARAFPVYRIVNAPDETTATYWGGIFLLVTLASIYPHLALAVKRFHDFDRPGWFAVIYLIGDFIVFLFLSLAPGTSGPNQYGARTNAPK